MIGGYGLVPDGLEGLVSDFTNTYCFQFPFSPLIHVGSVHPSLKASVYTVLSGLMVAIVIHKYWPSFLVGGDIVHVTESVLGSL